MAKPLLLSIGNGKVQELVGGTNDYVPVWNASTEEWYAAPAPGGGGGSGTVTSVGLTGGTSGLVIGGTASPITTSGTYNLDAPLRFAWDTATPTEVAAAGQVAYNTDEGSLEQMLEGNHVKSVIGQTLHQKVLNDTGATLTEGQVVYVSGAQGNRVTVDLALADADSTSATIIGIVAYAIADGAEGYVLTEGLIKGVNTNGFTEGLPVYLSPTTPGALTQTKPTAPQHLVLVGYCVRADATVGEILVKTQNGYELSELHDVLITSPTSGQILVYDGTVGQTRWENATPTGSAGVTVTPGAGSLNFSLDSAYAPTFLGLALSGLSASQFVKTDASKNLVSQQFVSLTTEVTGTLPVGNGGTGKASVTSGRLLLGADTSAMTELAGSSTNDVVKWDGSAWTAGSVPAVTSVTLSAGSTGLTISGGSSQTITSTGTFTLAGTLNAANGGTGRDMSGDTGVVKVTGGTFSAAAIQNGDVDDNAGIARSKLAASSNTYRVVANGSDGKFSEVASTGTAGQYLASGGASALPTWASIPYDLSGEAVGSLAVDDVVFHFIAPRNFTMTALSQAATTTTVMKIQVDGTDASYPQVVTTGQTVTAKVTTAGTDVWFTVTGNV